MDAKPKKKTSTAAWVVLSVILTTIVLLTLGAISNNARQQQTMTSHSNSNQAALQDCISHNVAPLQQGAAIDPYQAQGLSNAARVALDSCKAQYPAE